MGRPRHLRVASLALAVLLLAACGGQPKADPPASSPTPSPTASSPSAPTMPALAKQHTDAGAKAFVRYYIALINWAGKTGDVSGLRALSAANCQTCSNFLKNIPKVYSAGGYIRGGAFEITQLGIPSGGSTRNRVVVAARVKFGEQMFRDSSSAKQGRHPGGRDLLTFIVVGPKRWRVSEWTSAR